MAESVFHVVQFGRQAGTFYEPGGAANATVLYPVSDPVIIGLDRASQYPPQDYGRNAMARVGTGFHGVRGSTFPLPSQWRFEDSMYILEAHYAGDVVPSALGGGLYEWVYPLETGIPTLVPLTVESGSETAQDQWAAVGAICNTLTLAFDDLDSPGAHPWSIDSDWMGVDRIQRALTAAVDIPTGLETMQGQNSLIHFGPTSEAFADLDELAASLISFSLATDRHVEGRPYGGDTDAITGFGFSEKTSGEVTMKIRINAASKLRVYDEWENGSSFMDDAHVRIHIPGSASKLAYIDFAVGYTAVPVGTRSGERVFEITGSIADDTTLDAPAQITLHNTISALEDGYGS